MYLKGEGVHVQQLDKERAKHLVVMVPKVAWIKAWKNWAASAMEIASPLPPLPSSR